MLLGLDSGVSRAFTAGDLGVRVRVDLLVAVLDPALDPFPFPEGAEESPMNSTSESWPFMICDARVEGAERFVVSMCRCRAERRRTLGKARRMPSIASSATLAWTSSSLSDIAWVE